MILVPVLFIHRKLSGPLTPSLARLQFKILPAARGIMMQCPKLMRIGHSGHLGRLFLLLAKADHGVVVELDAVDIGDIAEELRADEGLGVLGAPKVPYAVGYASGVGLAEAGGRDLIETGGIVREPGDGEGADGVLPCEVVFPEAQPIQQDRVLIVAHLDVLIWIQEGHPVVLVAVIKYTSFHCVILKPPALLRRNGFGRDVSEIEDLFGDVIIVKSRMGRERWVGPVVIYIEFSDAMVVVVVGEEFAELEGNFFHEETWRRSVSGCTSPRESWTYILRHTRPRQLGAEVDLPPIHSPCDGQAWGGSAPDIVHGNLSKRRRIPGANEDPEVQRGIYK